MFEKISYGAGQNGEHSKSFRYDGSSGVCPMRLPNDKAVLITRDRATTVAVLSGPQFAVASVPGESAVTGASLQSREGLLKLDKPKITAIRRAIGPIFTERSLAKYEPDLIDTSYNLADAIKNSKGPVDLITKYVQPYISAAIARTLGIPDQAVAKVVDFADRTLDTVETPADPGLARTAWDDLYSFTRELVDSKRKNPDASMISGVVSTLDGMGMTDDEVVHASATIVNGFPTPISIVSVVAAELLNNPEAVAACKKNPELWDRTIEEMMRYKAHFPVALPRVATEDVTIGETTIREGQVVIPSLNAALKDPEYADHPNDFDVNQDAKRRIIFGAGAHFCPGAALTKQWLNVGMQSLFTVVDNILLAVPYDSLNWQDGPLPVPAVIPVTTTK